MIIVLKPGATQKQVEDFSALLAKQNQVKVNAWYGEHSTVLGLLGDTAAVDIESIAAQDIVQSVKRVQEPYKKANRKFHPDDTVIDLGGGAVIGGGRFGVIAGPCSVECEEQIEAVAARVKAAGAAFLRGGAFKPRTSPYAFQGLRAEGLELLRHARKKTGLPIVTEIMSPAHLVLFEDVDIIQVGARNMQNFELLKELGAAAIEAAGSAENVGRKFEANFSGTDAGEWAENYADAIHRSSDEVKSFMVSNKALYGEMGITGDAAAELSKATTSLAYDFGNAFAMDDTEALGVVQDYISGNNAALEEYGIHIDEVALKNTALSMGLGDQIDEMDDATLAQVRMNALLGQTEKIQQSAANSTGGLVNSTKDLKGIWSEFMADAGSRFTPVIESLFSTILDSWPVIEPMLMQFVDMLSNGLAQAMPVITELGMTLLPILTDVLGSVFEAGLPLLQVFGDLAQTILPPVADIIGMIAETVMPPLVDILNTLNTSIIQPLVPVIQKLAEALLPPIAQLLGLISPILEAVSPVLEVIGDVLGVIAEVLGKVVGWLADGVGKVVGFFSNLFGGAKDSEEAVNDLSGSINGLDDAASKETSLVVDTSQYKEEVTGAAETTTEAVTESSNQAAEITDVNFMAMGASATAAYGTMQTDAETAWSAMQTAATTGTDAIVAQFSRITAAAREASNASNVQIGASIPHNAGGTDNFEGGPTWMNEEGGELAILPGGSAIIPADQTDRLMKSYTNNTTNNRSSRSVSFAPSVQITIAGNADSSTVANLKEQLRALFDELYQEAQAQDYTDRAMQAGFA